MAPRCKWDGLPKASEADNWILELWEELRSPIAAGSQLQVLRLRCRGIGLRAESAALEVWERVALVERAVTSYWAEMRAAEKG